MKNLLRPAALALLTGLLARPETALAGTETQYLTNGTFTQNSTGGTTSAPTYSWSGWTVSGNTGGFTYGNGPGYGPEVFVTNGVTAGRYGDMVVADNATSPDPDTRGQSAVYFVDDNAKEELSQSIYLAAGTYEVGFDAYATPSGYNNPANASLFAQIAGVTITQTSVSALASGTWTHFADNVTISDPGLFTFSFLYTSGPGTAKDVLVDDVYVINPSTLPGQGTFVPEPASAALLLAGVGIIVARARLPRRQIS